MNKRSKAVSWISYRVRAEKSRRAGLDEGSKELGRQMIGRLIMMSYEWTGLRGYNAGNMLRRWVDSQGQDVAQLQRMMIYIWKQATLEERGQLSEGVAV